jgi:hypothetical protein
VRLHVAPSSSARQVIVGADGAIIPRRIVTAMKLESGASEEAPHHDVYAHGYQQVQRAERGGGGGGGGTTQQEGLGGGGAAEVGATDVGSSRNRLSSATPMGWARRQERKVAMSSLTSDRSSLSGEQRNGGERQLGPDLAHFNMLADSGPTPHRMCRVEPCR